MNDEAGKIWKAPVEVPFQHWPEGVELALHQTALFDLSVSELCKYTLFCLRSCDRKMYGLFGFFAFNMNRMIEFKGIKQLNRNYLFNDISSNL